MEQCFAWSVLCLRCDWEREACELRLLKKQVFNLARRTRISKTSGCPLSSVTHWAVYLYNKYMPSIPESKRQHEMNTNDQYTYVTYWTPPQKCLDSLSDTVVKQRHGGYLSDLTPTADLFGLDWPNLGVYSMRGCAYQRSAHPQELSQEVQLSQAN